MAMDLLREGAKDLGLTLGARHMVLFERYYQELKTWNRRFNLTAITGYEEVQIKHFLDSLSCFLAFPSEALGPLPNRIPLQFDRRSLWCLDVGSGAGFPGLPVKILAPDIRMTLVDSTRKKVGFLRHMIDILELENVDAIHARAEELGQMAQHREKYDVVMARAVAHLPILCEYCLPLCRVGGRMIALKGQEAHKEAEESQKALDILGGALMEVKPVTLPILGPGHHLIAIDKVASTPDRYPRRPGVPAKRPLA
ncbi:MAG: 16S rRNA (guanine(527)-N(7))-methyltransferase RsmG [Chloroflexota bacterium]|nr:16S rRNA (guanine(527)-N(7))-methyltransferase RsmG [Chloroflexota bacterium]